MKQELKMINHVTRFCVSIALLTLGLSSYQSQLFGNSGDDDLAGGVKRSVSGAPSIVSLQESESGGKPGSEDSAAQLETNQEAWAAIVMAARDEEMVVRVAALEAIAYMSPLDDKALLALRNSLRSREEEEGMVAFHSLNRSLKNPETLMEIYVNELLVVQPGVQQKLLQTIKANQSVAFQPLIQLIESNMSSDDARKMALEILAGWGPDAGEAVGTVLQFVKLGDPQLETALNTLAALQVVNPQVIASIVALTENDSPEVRVLAVTTLGTLVTGGKTRSPLGSASKEEHPAVAAVFDRMDKNRDGKIDETDGVEAVRFMKAFDKNGDLTVTREEVQARYENSPYPTARPRDR